MCQGETGRQILQRTKRKISTFYEKGKFHFIVKKCGWGKLKGEAKKVNFPFHPHSSKTKEFSEL
jgi:hypothetical protein